jgi:Do/DeqQ family serine protease
MRRSAFVTLLIGCGFAAGLVLTGRMRDAADAVAQPQASAPAAAPAQAPPSGVPTTMIDFSRIAERAVPAVVNVSSSQIVQRRVSNPFDAFFGTGDRVYRSQENSLGSGVIVSEDGYILTNNHVITGESRRGARVERLDVTISLADKREMSAELVGTDPTTDLALLKVDARNLTPMPWGDSSRLKVAEWVLAIGNPFQLNQSVTLGIVSAVGRTNLGASSYEDFVQTDAAINPGNSGGALVNARGELVGINTFIFSQSGGYDGIGFAVSSNLARRVFNDLRQYGEVRRGEMVGLAEVVPLTTREAEALGAPDTRGALVNSIYQNSPAFRAGIRPGDVIVSFNGTAVTDVAHLSRLVSDARIGSTARVGVIREARRLELEVPIDTRSRG